MVSFGVSRSGGLSYVRLARSSGVSALDQAALAAVRRSAPFPPPPAGVPAGRLTFSMPFYFR
jgi:protein TonB